MPLQMKDGVAEIEAGTSSEDESSWAGGKGAADMIEKLGGTLENAINPWAAVNVSLPLSYFCVGFAMSFVDTPLKVGVRIRLAACIIVSGG